MSEPINEVSTLALYSDYGDLSGVQTVRRLIEHINKHFKSVNASTNEIIRVVNKLTEIVTSTGNIDILISEIAMVKGLVTGKASIQELTDGLALKADKTELTPIRNNITGIETDILDLGQNVEHFNTTFTSTASSVSLFNTEMNALIDGELNDSFVSLEDMVAQLKLIKPVQP